MVSWSDGRLLHLCRHTVPIDRPLHQFVSAESNNLGDMDGVRVLQTYRFGRLHLVPALFLTADATLQTATRLQDAGGAGIL